MGKKSCLPFSKWNHLLKIPFLNKFSNYRKVYAVASIYVAFISNLMRLYLIAKQVDLLFQVLYLTLNL